MAPIREKCLFRLLTFVPGGKPAVTARYFSTFRRTYRIYRAVAAIPHVRVQVQQLVAVPSGSSDQGDAREWRVVCDNTTLGNVHHVANPGMATPRRVLARGKMLGDLLAGGL